MSKMMVEEEVGKMMVGGRGGQDDGGEGRGG